MDDCGLYLRRDWRIHPITESMKMHNMLKSAAAIIALAASALAFAGPGDFGGWTYGNNGQINGVVSLRGIVTPIPNYLTNGTIVNSLCSDKDGNIIPSSGTNCYGPGVIDIRGYGAKSNGQAVYNAAITSVSGNTYQVVSSSALFTPADVGKVAASVAASAGTQYGLDSTITAYINATTIQINCTSGAVVANPAIFVWGTDDTTAINAAIAAASAANSPSDILIPLGITMATQSLTLPDGVSMIGVQNSTVVGFSYQFKFSGSNLVLANYLAGNPFVTAGSALNPSAAASNIRLVTVDSMNLAAAAVYSASIGNNYSQTTFGRGTGQNLYTGASSVVTDSVFYGSEQGSSLIISGDNRLLSNYIFGAGPGYPTVEITSSDVWFAGNHLWRDGDVDPIGDLILVDVAGGSTNVGDITIDANQFDTPVGANINITITGNTTVRSINIIGNHSLTNDTVQNNPTAVVAAANMTLTSGSPTMVVSSIGSGTVQGTNGTIASASSGTIYRGSIVTGAGIPAGTRVSAQTTGTIGGAGTYTLSANATATSSGTYNFTGYPYISLNIAAGSTLRMLNVVGNIGLGSWDNPALSPYSNFIDGTGLQGSLLYLNVSNNAIDNCGAGYGAKYGGFTALSPTVGAGTNALIINSASNSPTTF